MSVDFVAHSLDAVPETLSIAEVAVDEPWESIGILHKRFAPRRILGIFPSHLQIDTRFYRALRAVPLPSLCVAQEQMLGGLSLVETLKIGGIVTVGSALSACLEGLEKFVPKADVYIQVAISPTGPLPATNRERIFFEIHEVPGSPLLYQCEHIAGSHSFHATARFSALEGFSDGGACTCKKPLVEKK